MTQSLIVDTGFFVALGNRGDRHHERAVKVAEQYEGYSWYTSWPVITETVHILPTQASLNFLRAQKNGFFKIMTLTEVDLPRIADLLERYRKQRIDLADISLVILAEQLRRGDILTCDQRDFSILRWSRNRLFNNLFLD